jgi:hypothetical protein
VVHSAIRDGQPVFHGPQIKWNAVVLESVVNVAVQNPNGQVRVVLQGWVSRGVQEHWVDSSDMRSKWCCGLKRGWNLHCAVRLAKERVD